MKSVIGRRIPQILFIIAILLFIVFAVLNIRSIGSLSEALTWDKQTQQVLLQLEETLITKINAETSVRGFIITGDESILAPYNEARQNVKDRLTKLRELTAGNQNQAERVVNLEKMLDERFAFFNQIVEARKTRSIDEIRPLFNDPRGRVLSENIRRSIKQLKDEETALLNERERELNESVSYSRTIAYIAGFAGFFFLGFAALVNIREGNKRVKAEDDLRLANKDLEKRVEERTQQLQLKNEELEDQIRRREESEQYRRIALEAGSLGTWIFDPVNDKAEIDERGLSLFGFTENDFDGSGKNIFSRIYKEDFPTVQELFQKSLAEKSNFNAEFRVLMPDGAIRWNNCTGQAQVDESGTITRIIGNCRDITDGKESEFALRRSEKQVRNVIDNLFAFVGVLSPDGVLVEANRTALNAASLNSEDVIGKDFAETYWWSYSEDVQNQLRESIEKAAAGESVRYDANVRIGENKFIPIDFMLAPLYDEDGQITHLIPSGLDLTPRKEAEDALRKSENFANAILDSLSAHIAVVDEKGEIIAVNEAWEIFAETNCLEEDLVNTGVGQNYLDVCRRAQKSVSEAGVIFENLEAILKGEKRVFSVEYPCHSPNEDRWFMLQITAMQGDGGGAVISHINITDRKKAEIKLRNSEQFNRSIFESSPDSVMVLETDGRMHSINTSGMRLMEIDDFAPLTEKNWIDFWEGDEKETANQAVQQALKGKITHFEGFRRTVKGTPKWWEVMVAPVFNERGKPTLLISNSRDITDRKKAELELKNSEQFNRSIFENSPDCVKILELDGTLHSMNVNGLCVMEIDDFTPYVGKQWVDFWEGDENEMAYQSVEAAKRGQTANFQGFCRTAKGTLKWWDVSVAPVFDADGKPIRIISTSRDISERREAEREREDLLRNEKAARKDAEIANRLRDEFLATVSHELRAPLNSILGWGRLLERGTLDEATTEKALKTIVRNAESQNRLIEDLLDVSRIISGKLRLEVMTVKPINIVESALETVRPAAEAKGIKLEIKQDSIISHISGDPNRLQQVIWNLLSNAIKFTPSDGRVTLEIERENEFVNLRVKDTGVGIKEEFLPHVFDRFRQADASSIRKFGGLGLGLAIVRHITEMHGGTVHVESEGEGKGSTFTVRLPLLIASEEDDSTTNSGETLFTDKDPLLNLDGLLILVVDDEEDTRQLLIQALTFYGATVISAASTEEAMSEIQDKNPDFLVSDIGMPDEDGYSLIRRIRNLENQQHKNIPAVALTAFTRAQDRMRALAAGFQNHVPKPVEPDELITVIASLTGRLNIGDEN